MSDDEQLDLITPRPPATLEASCNRCGREMLAVRLELAGAERAPFDAWVGITAYVDVPEHRVLRAVARRRASTRARGILDLPDLEILCSIDCKG